METLLRHLGAVFGWTRQVWWVPDTRIVAKEPRFTVHAEIVWRRVEEWLYVLLYWPAYEPAGFAPQRDEHLVLGIFSGLRDYTRGRHWDRRRSR